MLLFLIPVVLFVTMYGCIKDNPAPEVPVTKYSEEIIFLANLLGCDASKITETQDGYVFEGDVNFSKDNFWKNYNLSDTSVQDRAHRRHQYLPKAQIVKINYRPSLPQVWKDAVSAAKTNWNSMPLAPYGNLIFMVTTQDVNNVPNALNVKVTSDAIFTPIQLPNGQWSIAFGATNPPTATGVGGTLKISSWIGQSHPNPIVNNALNWNASERLYLITHEIGHGIGMAHTDTQEGWGNLYYSTACNGNDASSVMKGQTGKTPWSGFTTCDKDAYKKLCVSW